MSEETKINTMAEDSSLDAMIKMKKDNFPRYIAYQVVAIQYMLQEMLDEMAEYWDLDKE